MGYLKGKLMAVPKSKISKSKRGMRRAHASLKCETINECPNCGEIRRPHHVCPACGFYNAMEIVNMSEQEQEIEEDVA